MCAEWLLPLLLSAGSVVVCPESDVGPESSRVGIDGSCYRHDSQKIESKKPPEAGWR